jgi:hypothetical protein
MLTLISLLALLHAVPLVEAWSNPHYFVRLCTNVEFPFEYRTEDTSPDRPWVVGQIHNQFAFEMAQRYQTQAGWRHQGDDSSAVIFKFDSTLPLPIEADYDGLYTIIIYNHRIYADYCSALSTSATKRDIVKRDVWEDGTFLPFPPVVANVRAYNEECPASTMISVESVDANGNVNSATGRDSASFVLPVDAAYPIKVKATSDYANATATIVDTVPLTYALGDGDNIPVLSFTRELAFDICAPDVI